VAKPPVVDRLAELGAQRDAEVGLDDRLDRCFGEAVRKGAVFEPGDERCAT
jgi:hypothetical protein